jgi:hypothetical protein
MGLCDERVVQAAAAGMEAIFTVQRDERMPLVCLGVAVFVADAALSLTAPADGVKFVMLCTWVASWDAGELR